MGSARMPAAFISHGTARETIERTDHTAQWAELGRRIPRPRAIVVVSAHWYIQATAATAMARPRTIHDFFYPPGHELYDFLYPAPGSPELAAHLRELVKPHWLGLDIDSWGLDHGAYSILAHAFPGADVPVVEVSVHASAPAAYHLAVGAALDPLRDEGVLVLASGTLVHNPRAIDEAARTSGAYDLAASFVMAVREQLATDPAGAVDLDRHPGHPICAPTPDHYLPLLYLAGMAVASGEKVTVPFHDPIGDIGPCSFAVGLDG